MSEADVPWAYDLAKRRYPPNFDIVTCEGWFRNIVLKQPVLFCPQRMPNAFCITMLAILPWLPSDVECNVVMICCEENCMWEGMKLLRSSIAWGKQRRCTLWRLSSDTDYDLANIAKRLGATEISPRYILRY